MWRPHWIWVGEGESIQAVQQLEDSRWLVASKYPREGRQPILDLEDARFTMYEDEREKIVTSVSAYMACKDNKDK